MNNIFLFDIDGTLSINGIIPESAKEIIKRIRNKGDLVLLATGRCKFQMKPIEEIIETDGAIMNNGGYIVVKDKVIAKHPISKDAIKRLLDMGFKTALLNDKYYARIDSDKIYKEFSDYFKVPEATLYPKDILKEDMYSLGVYSYHADTFPKELFPEIDFVRVAPLGFDVIAHGISKGSAVLDLRKIYKDARIIAFGDNYNDLEMLKEADISIVVPTAPKEVQKVASFVTKNPLDDGIAYAIKEFLKYED